uniref:Truncated envelope glycoprotein n=1 Tax=Human immunodeficiency virus type 1 TaxID=11676 RepID=A0A0H3YA96_HV1|nr:truncated envelope glycoprotein [Human immunodeficiency virus 1]
MRVKGIKRNWQPWWI